MAKHTYAASAQCPCHNDVDYEHCCQPWHLGWAQGHFAPTPVALMRSRYSAYVLGLIDYLLASWHPSTAPGELELQAVKWLGLDIKASTSSGTAGVVEFVARYRDSSGRAQRLHEISRFVQENGHWLYIDGDIQE